MEWMDWTGRRGHSGRSDGDWALQKRMQLEQALKEQGGSPHGKRLDQATEPWGQSLTAGSSAPASAVINC